ncbi:hypothetical protein CY35_02G018900 [Sphagnum magellanicum]|nr:hypothetical protein CY35_02G018900 [Sphagnum magellanicum]
MISGILTSGKGTQLQGKVTLPPLAPPPEPLRRLLTGKETDAKDFRQHIRSYNSALAFTYVGANLDNNVTQLGNDTYRLRGELYHRMGSLLPQPGEARKFGQLYINDLHAELDGRMGNFATKQLQGRVIELSLRLVNDRRINLRCYNAPTINEIGTLMVGGDVDEVDAHDIVMRSTNGYFQRLFPLHSAYTPLHYNRLKFIRENQRHLRCDLYNGLQDALNAGNILGNDVGQKMILLGLPHAHILLILNEASKLRTVEDFDSMVSAKISDLIRHPEAYETVTSCMVHGSCGPDFFNTQCMEQGKCKKRYLRSFSEETRCDVDGYPEYRRRQTRIFVDPKTQCMVDNRWIVPYNLHLATKYHAHINVEICSSIFAVKYLYKYVYKGLDRATAVVERQVNRHGQENNAQAVVANGEGQNHDEIKAYFEGRYVSASEALWHLFSFRMHEGTPSITCLTVHEPGMHKVVYNDNASIFETINSEQNQKTTLTEYFQAHINYPLARKVTYMYLPSMFTWTNGTKKWTIRQRRCFVERLYFVSPSAGECYFLRTLLTKVKGVISFEVFCTINGVIHDTFKSTCIAFGLYDSDDKWNACLEEAIGMQTGAQLRSLFMTILTFGVPGEPRMLWDKYKEHICDDCKRAAHDGLINAYAAHHAKVIFIDGPGGMSKTYTENLILNVVRSRGDIALAVASSCIAALLLSGAWTTHLYLKIPIALDHTSFCYIRKQDDLAALIRQTKFILWDEAPMTNKLAFEAVDRTLRDLTDRNEPFSGIVFVMSGDFHQVLSIIPRRSHADIIFASIKNSYLWEYVEVFRLSENMRVNDAIVVTNEYLRERAILAPRNKEVSLINVTVLSYLPGTQVDFFSADFVDDMEVANTYPSEFLNTLEVSGMPSHKLPFKIGAPVMLLRNLDPSAGLCNGTHLIIRCFTIRVVEAEIITGKGASNVAFIPRIKFIFDNNGLSFTFARKQFPLWLAYAMTINKSQGQTLSHVGLHLTNDVFSHGQLYVAFSRAKAPMNIKVQLLDTMHGRIGLMRNVVYEETLL